jgi:hypothetical protein
VEGRMASPAVSRRDGLMQWAGSGLPWGWIQGGAASMPGPGGLPVGLGGGKSRSGPQDVRNKKNLCRKTPAGYEQEQDSRCGHGCQGCSQAGPGHN